ARKCLPKSVRFPPLRAGTSRSTLQGGGETISGTSSETWTGISPAARPSGWSATGRPHVDDGVPVRPELHDALTSAGDHQDTGDAGSGLGDEARHDGGGTGLAVALR